MNFEELYEEVPYGGFHDAEIYSLSIDYLAKVVKISLDIVVGEEVLPEGGFRWLYKRANWGIIDFDYVVIDCPDRNYKYFSKKTLSIDVFEGRSKENSAPLPEASEGSTEFYIYVSNWNGFIRIAAKDFSISWH